jgi:hypothetical protein
MRLYSLNGRLVNKNVSRYLVDWDKSSRSKIQFNIKKFFEQYWKSHIVYEEFPVYGSLMKVDLLNATKRIAIEVNGEQHENFNEFFHANSRMNYLQSIKRDCKKAEWLEKNNFKFIELYQKDLKNLSPNFFLENFDINIF